MNLNDLYPRGTKLEDVPPFFQGMPPEEHRRLSTFSMVTAAAAAAPKIEPKDAPLNKKAFWTPRDDYGSRSL